MIKTDLTKQDVRYRVENALEIASYMIAKMKAEGMIPRNNPYHASTDDVAPHSAAYYAIAFHEKVKALFQDIAASWPETRHDRPDHDFD